MEIAMADKEGGEIPCDANGFQSVPEECIASMIALTTPADAFRLGLVSRAFLAASESNFVWERFLPSDYDLIVARSDDGEALLAEFQQRKKQLYLRLADRPLLVDAASKSFWVDKLSGKKCWMIAARSLTIPDSDRPRNWKWTSIPESRFPEVAEIIHVELFDIRGSINTSTLSPGTQYAACLVFRLTDDADGLHADIVTLVHINGVFTWGNDVYIDPRGKYPACWHHEIFPKLRTDGWKEVKIGMFFTQPGEEGKVNLALREDKYMFHMKGLIVQGIEFRPWVQQERSLSVKSGFYQF